MTHRQLVKAAATVRNQTVTYAGVTPLQLAFGRRPADLIQLDAPTPTQLTIDRNEEELTAIQIKQLSKQARQSEDTRQDLAQNLQMSSRCSTGRRMKPSFWGNLELTFYCQKSENPCRRSKQAPPQTPRKRSHPHQLLSQDPQCHCV